jgi:hypothetical protein
MAAENALPTQERRDRRGTRAHVTDTTFIHEFAEPPGKAAAEPSAAYGLGGGIRNRSR